MTAYEKTESNSRLVIEAGGRTHVRGSADGVSHENDDQSRLWVVCDSVALHKQGEVSRKAAFGTATSGVYPEQRR